MTPNYNSNSTIQHYRRNSTVHTPLLLPLFPACLAKRPFLRETRTLLQVAQTLHGHIYTIPTIYIFYAVIYIIRTSTVICSDNIYIFLCGDIYIIGTSRNVSFGEARAPQGQGPSAIIVFLFLCFVYFSRSFVNKDLNEPNNTTYPTDHTLLRPRWKTLCHDHLEQILSTFKVEIIHHLVLAT